MTGSRKTMYSGILLLVIVCVLAGYDIFFTANNYATAPDIEPVVIEAITLSEPPEGLSDFELGQYYFNQEEHPDGAYDLDRARHYYSKVILEDPSAHHLVWYQLGRIDFIQGDFSAALYKFDKQIEYFGDEIPNVYYMIGLTHGYKARATGDTDDWERGADGFLQYIEYDATSPWSRVDLAWIYFAQGKYEAMLAPLEEGLRYVPDNAWLLNMYGLALMNTDRRAEAKDQFLQAKISADQLTEQDWGLSYPGNNPNEWGRGLAEFRSAIDKNIALVNDV